jgi:hypothetical protein
MQPELKDIAERVLKLPPTARAYLAEVLLQSLDYEDDFPVSEEWIKEIQALLQFPEHLSIILSMSCYL